MYSANKRINIDKIISHIILRLASTYGMKEYKISTFGYPTNIISNRNKNKKGLALSNNATAFSLLKQYKQKALWC